MTNLPSRGQLCYICGGTLTADTRGNPTNQMVLDRKKRKVHTKCMKRFEKTKQQLNPN